MFAWRWAGGAEPGGPREKGCARLWLGVGSRDGVWPDCPAFDLYLQVFVFSWCAGFLLKYLFSKRSYSF